MSYCICPEDRGRIIRYADNPCPIHGKSRPGQGAVGPVNEVTRTTPDAKPDDSDDSDDSDAAWLRSHGYADLAWRHQRLSEMLAKYEASVPARKQEAGIPMTTAADPPPFPIGALVQLNSGSPTMTITDTDRRVVKHDADGKQIWQTTLFTLWITPDSAWHNLAAPSECFKAVKA